MGKTPEPREIKGCARYGMGVELTLLRRRLNSEDLPEAERASIMERIRRIEEILDV